MPELSRELLERPVEETARLIALSLLEEAAAGAKRLRSGDDPEALHDFRVGLRRLRSTLRAYRSHLRGSVSQKLRKKLKALAGATSPARDTEVQLAWLEPQVEGLAEPQRIGARWLIEHLSGRGGPDTASSLQEVIDRFDAIGRDLADKLTLCTFRLDRDAGAERATFITETGRLISEQVRALERNLSSVHGVDDDAAIHRTRISGKRLRYLLEPLRRNIPAAKSLVRQMKELQDVLGHLHDTKLLETKIVSALETSAVERARRLQQSLRLGSAEAFSEPEDTWEERHGLLEILRRLEARGRELFETVETRFLGEEGRRLLDRIDALGRRLSGRQGRPERARRFLLSQLPDVVRGAPRRSVELGWLGGTLAREMLRRERTGRRLSYYRIHRGVEEPVPRRVFAALWPLTDKRRLRKHCYTLNDAERTWRVSELPDAGLVLAELDPPGGDAELELPAWLARTLVKEVTGDVRYEDGRLVRLRRRRKKPAAGRKNRTKTTG